MSERRFSRRVAIHGRLTKPSVRSVPRGGSPRLRRGAERDIAALVELEQAVFAGDRLSLRQFRHHLDAPSTDLIVAANAGAVDGYALLFRRRGSLIGPVLGAGIVNGMKSWFTVAFPEYWLFALGALFILVTLYLPKGVIGLLRKKGEQ